LCKFHCILSTHVDTYANMQLNICTCDSVKSCHEFMRKWMSERLDPLTFLDDLIRVEQYANELAAPVQLHLVGRDHE